MELMDSLMQQYYDSMNDAYEAIYEEGRNASLNDDCPYENESWMEKAWFDGFWDGWLYNL